MVAITDRIIVRMEERYERRGARFLESQNLHHVMKKYAPAMAALQPQERNYPLRIALVTVLVIGILAFILKSQDINFSSIPREIKRFFMHHIGWRGGLVISSITILVGGAFFIIYKVTRNQGRFWGDAHYKPVVLYQAVSPTQKWVRRLGGPPQELVDLSLLDAQQTGTTTAVQRKEMVEHEIIVASTLVAAPLIGTGSVIYNIARCVIVPFYILGRMVQERWTGKQIYDTERKFRLSDIPKQMALSIYWAARAPFYALAYFFSALYACIDPMGGRKLGMLICKAWMCGVERRHSIWTCHQASDQFKWEGGGGPDSLGRQAYFWTGCWMPWATVTVENGIVKKAVYPDNVFEYDVYEPEDAGISVPDLVQLPEILSDEDIETLRQQLQPGQYRYVRRTDHSLHVIACVTQRSDRQTYYVSDSIRTKFDPRTADLDIWLNKGSQLTKREE